MSLEEFSNGLGDELEALTAGEGNNTLDKAKEISLKILLLIKKLREFIYHYRFESKEEEIHFFRNIKPKFFTKLIYFQKIFELQSGMPVGMQSDIKDYYLTEFNCIKKYIDRNKEFLTYYRSGSSVFDEIYFLPKEPDLWLSLNTDECEQNSFSTIYDYKLSKLLAYEQVSVFIIEAINFLESDSSSVVNLNSPREPGITWTAPKAALIELLYAIQTTGACNNGTIEVKQLASHFENIFNVKLGNFYRTFQEIRIRKMSRTSFLDEMRESLIKRMDESDENPRY